MTWGTFQNGKRRSFEVLPADQVAPGDRYAYSRRARAVVCLDGEDVPVDPVLTPHRCRPYVEALIAARDPAAAGDIVDQLPFLAPRT